MVNTHRAKRAIPFIADAIIGSDASLVAYEVRQNLHQAKTNFSRFTNFGGK